MPKPFYPVPGRRRLIRFRIRDRGGPGPWEQVVEIGVSCLRNVWPPAEAKMGDVWVSDQGQEQERQALIHRKGSWRRRGRT